MYATNYEKSLVASSDKRKKKLVSLTLYLSHAVVTERVLLNME